MTQSINKSWVPRRRCTIFADEDVDGLMSATIVAKKYLENYQIKFVTARSLTDALRRFKRSIDNNRSKDPQLLPKDLDVYIVDVGINKASIGEFSELSKQMTSMGIRVLYFDSHSNKYNGQTLLPDLEKAGVMVHLGEIGTAAASVIQNYLGNKGTERLRKLGALSDRELSFNELQDMQSEKEGLRLLQAAVAWGAWKERSFLHRISRELIYDSQVDFTKHEEILEFSNLANRHRDNLYRYIIRNAEVLQIASNPRILAVFCMNRNDFGKARGTIAGHLAGEWSSVILLITKDDTGQNYNISIRNHYKMSVDLERLGQLALAESAGGSKGAYRITLKKDKLMTFIIAIQQWAYSLNPRWVRNVKNDKNK